MKEQLMNVLNNLNAIEVKGSSVMILGQVMFDLGNLIEQLDKVEREGCAKNQEPIDETKKIEDK